MSDIENNRNLISALQEAGSVTDPEAEEELADSENALAF